MDYWKFTDNVRWTNGRALRQIKAARTFKNGRVVEEGQLGGWIDDSSVLTQTGAWIEEGSVVLTRSRIQDQAWVGGSSVVEFQCLIQGAARVVDSEISGECVLKDSFRCCESALNDGVVAGDGAYFVDVVATGRSKFEGDMFVKSARIKPRDCLFYKQFFNGIYESRNVSFYIDEKNRIGAKKHSPRWNVMVGIREPYGFSTNIAVPFLEFYQKCRARNREEKWSDEYRKLFSTRLGNVLKKLR